MRFGILVVCAGLVLAGCTPQVPNDAVNNRSFEDARRAQAAREAALTGRPAPTTTPSTVDADGTEFTVLTPTITNVPVDASPSNPTPQAVVARNTAGISDENDFDAVASRQSIESDAARLAANRQQYQVIAPTDLPSRSGSGPNVVAYALQTDNPVGVALYRRIGFTTENRHLRNCARYASSELAQQEFLSRGGPVRDRLGLDPDGDGFACRWDPTPFRKINQ